MVGVYWFPPSFMFLVAYDHKFLHQNKSIPFSIKDLRKHPLTHGISANNYYTILHFLLAHIVTDNNSNTIKKPLNLRHFTPLITLALARLPSLLPSAPFKNHQPTHYLTQADALENLTMALFIQRVTHSPEASRANQNDSLLSKRLEPAHGCVGQTPIHVLLASSSFVSPSSIHPSNHSRSIQRSFTSVILHTSFSLLSLNPYISSLV